MSCKRELNLKNGGFELQTGTCCSEVKKSCGNVGKGKSEHPRGCTKVQSAQGLLAAQGGMAQDDPDNPDDDIMDFYDSSGHGCESIVMHHNGMKIFLGMSLCQCDWIQLGVLKESFSHHGLPWWVLGSSVSDLSHHRVLYHTRCSKSSLTSGKLLEY